MSISQSDLTLTSQHYNKFPVAEVCRVVNFTSNVTEIYDGTNTSLKRFVDRVGSEKFTRLQMQLTLNRFSNKVCSKCVDHSFPKERLQVCPRCNMTFYCSDRCRDADAQRHAGWCMQIFSKDAIDEGPMKIVFLKLPEPKNESKVV
jgi:hypothetical protein